MGARTWIVVSVAAVAAGAGAALWLTRPAVLVAAPPNAELAPANLVVWTEADDLQGAWTAFKTSESWKDLQASALVDEFRQSETGKGLSDLLAQIESKGGYAIDSSRAMHFLGREVSLGFGPPPQEGAAPWIAFAKLDVEALIRELLDGKGDWTRLLDDLERRTGRMDFAVTRSEHGGVRVLHARRGDLAFHASLLGDTLAVASDDALLKESIARHAAGGEGSLGRSARFREEVARLPDRSTLRAWADLEAMRKAGPQFAQGVTSDAKGAAGIARVLEGTSGAAALAIGTDLRAGDLYAATWAWTRSAAELTGSARIADLGALTAAFPFTLETRDLASVARAWEASSLRRRLSDGPIGAKVREWMDDLKGAADGLRSTPFGAALPGGPRFPGMQEEDDPEKERFDRGLHVASDRFVQRLAWHLAWTGIKSGFTGDFAMGVRGPAERGDDPEVFGAVRVGTDGLLLLLFGEGVSGVRATEVAGTSVWRLTEGHRGGASGFAAHAGDAFLVASSEESLRLALTNAAAGSFTTRLPDGWTVRARYEMAALLDSLPGAERREMRDMLQFSWPTKGETGVYVGDRLETVEVRSVAAYGVDRGLASFAGDPAAWMWMPEGAILGGGVHMDLARLFQAVTGVLPEGARGDLDEALAEASRDLGVDIREELLPALGPELAVVVTRSAAGATQGRGSRQETPVPGVLLGLGVKNDVVVARAVDSVVRLVETEIEDSGGRMPVRIVREPADGRSLVRFEIRDDDVPFTLEPTVIFGRGWLAVGMERTVVQSALDTEAGRAKGFGASALAGRVRADLPGDRAAWSVLDWGAMLDQIAVYAPQIAQAFPPDVLPSGRRKPAMPAQFDEQSWTKFQQETEAYEAEARTAGDAHVRKWIDACRLIDYMAGATSVDGLDSTERMLIRFAK